MQALILAAGVGRRIGADAENLPKALLRFGGQSLLERHIAMLGAAGVKDISIVVGYRADAIEGELARLGRNDIRLIDNPRYREGSMVSLWSAREVLREGEPVLLMDADVLYGSAFMAALLAHPAENCFLLDRDVEPGDEPQKLCIRGGAIVDLHKKPSQPHEWYGESIGFLRCTPRIAALMAARTDAYVAEGRVNVEHEEAIRDLILSEPAGTFGYADVTGEPWLEIDFPEDVRRATREILPRLS